jgi:hypothetical protein
VSVPPEESRARYVEALERGQQARQARVRQGRDIRRPDKNKEWWIEVDRLIAERRRAEREDRDRGQSPPPRRTGPPGAGAHHRPQPTTTDVAAMSDEYGRSEKPRRRPKHIIGLPRPVPTTEQRVIAVEPGCATYAAALTGGGYCRSRTELPCGGCGDRDCRVCRGSNGRPTARWDR